MEVEKFKKEILKVLKFKSHFGNLDFNCHGVDVVIISELIKWSLSEKLFIDINVYDKPEQRNYIHVKIDTENIIGKRVNLYSADYRPDLKFHDSYISFCENEILKIRKQKEELLAKSDTEKQAFEEIKNIKVL